MGLTASVITGADLVASRNARLDPRYHQLRARSAPLHEALVDPIPFGLLADFTNGQNVPRQAYAFSEEDGEALYASVAAFPLYVMRRKACVPLLATNGLITGTTIRIEAVACTDREVLLTRSRASAPGVAWPADAAPADAPVVPAGFLIRARLDDGLDPAYVAALLNHPAWRLLTAALAAGKSQDNLSQELLAHVPIPSASLDAQAEIAMRYRAFMNDVSQILDDEGDFAAACDSALERAIGLSLPTVADGDVVTAQVSLKDVAATRSLRLDNRWHSPQNTAIRSELMRYLPTSLKALLDGQPTKGRQPTYLQEDEADEESLFAIATISLQSGIVVAENTKPTTPESAARFPVVTGELLVAMDGDGSLGKAAVYGGEEDTTVDSHVARVRVAGGRDAADAVSCFLNSTWGRNQTASLMTGATGQTQLSPTDLSEVILPASISTPAESVATEYRATLRSYEPVARRVRRRLCDESAGLTETLIADGVLAEAQGVRPFRDPSWLLATLDGLTSFSSSTNHH